MDGGVVNYEFTDYFNKEVLRKRPYIRKEWCIRIVDDPIACEQQEDNRWRFWGKVSEYGDRYFRVITLADRLTIHNAFPDRDYRHES